MTSIKPAPLPEVWSMRQLVMYPNESIDFVKLDDDAAGLHWGVYESGRLLSVISVFENDATVQFRKLATLPSEQGKGYGSALLQYVMDQAVKNGKTSIWCNARLSATGIYRRFGMRETGDSWIKYGIDFIKMEKQLD